MINVIFDFESLGLSENSVLLSLGVVVFDTSDFYIQSDGVETTFNKLLKKGLYIKMDVKDQIEKYGRTIDKSTLMWWTEQGEDAQKVLKKTENDVKLSEMEKL